MINLYLKNSNNLKRIQKKVRNCEFRNFDNILSELYKRIAIPLYLPALMLTSLLLIINSKEKINFTRLRVITFLIGFFIIIFSESALRFISFSMTNNLLIALIPIFSIIIFYFYFIFKLKTKISK